MQGIPRQVYLCPVHAFKARKEKDSQSSLSNRSANKKRRIENKDVVIQIGVMDENGKMRRGRSIPLKVGSSATAEAIFSTSVKKHSVFDKRFDCGVLY